MKGGGGEDGLGMWGRNAAAVKLLRSEVIDRDRGRWC